MSITADDIINGVNRRISNPESQGLLENTDVLAFADNVVQSELVPIMESSSQDYFVQRIDITLVGGQSTYSVPYRSVGRAVREVKLRYEGENNYRNMPLVSIENSNMYYGWDTTVGFHFEGDDIRLVPDVPDSFSSPAPTLVVWQRIPPNKLVASSEVAQVVSIAGADVTVDAIPDTMGAGTLVDFCQSKSGSAIYSYDVAIQSVSSPVITFASASDVPSQLTAGDYISISGQSYVLNWIPNEAFPLVETLTARRCLQAISDYQGIKLLDADAAMERTNLKMLLEPRISGESTIIVNYWNLTRANKNNQRSWLYGQ